MKHSLLAATLLLSVALPSMAFAQTTVTSNSDSTSTSTSGSVAGAINEGNTTTVTIEGAEAPAIPRDRYQAPPNTVVQAAPTMPCTLTGGLGVSVPGGSFSAGAGRVNQQCMLYERARVIAQGLGDRQWATELLMLGDEQAAEAYERARAREQRAQAQSSPVQPATTQAPEGLRGRNDELVLANAVSTGEVQGPTQ